MPLCLVVGPFFGVWELRVEKYGFILTLLLHFEYHLGWPARKAPVTLGRFGPFDMKVEEPIV